MIASKRLIATWLSAFALSMGLVVPYIQSDNASALNAADWKAGRIIDDAIFFNKGAMSVSQIQQFLNAKVPVCDTNHNASFWQYGYWNAPPYTCLKDYQESGKSSAQIIWEAAQTYGINPQVLLVILQKETGIVTDTWAAPWQYKRATGYRCPDSSLGGDVDANQNGCYDQYENFTAQIGGAAYRLRDYVTNANSYNFKAGVTRNILYNPSTSCGSSPVYIASAGTAALYNYTPYQPNAAAFANMYSTGDSCSSYGNRNFWRIFNDWFGSTISDANAISLNFVRLNHSSGQAEIVAYSSIGSYSFPSRYTLSGYPAVTADGSVVPLFKPNGDLSFIRLNHSSGKVEVVTYGKFSEYKQLVEYTLSGYPAVTADGSVVPLFKPNGDLSFIRLNHSSGKVEVVTYGASSQFQQIVEYQLTGYPAVPGDGSVRPVFRPDGLGNLSFIRLNHSSGKVEVVTYGAKSGYKNIIDYRLSSYPAVITDGSVLPFFQPDNDGNLSFIRLNHSSGKVELVSYAAASGYQDLYDYKLTGYPAVAPDGSVVPLFTKQQP